ncbi:MAG: response regulator [Chitinophagaceae bacterium]|nr:response regulator [Chitinophagaceae bacterium]
MSKQKVLIIEDDPGIASMLRSIMLIAKVEAIHADSGKKGLELLRIENIGMIICDIMLPDIIGYDILKQVRAEQETHIPFVFLTAFADPADVQRGLNAGADRYLTKPFAASTLLKAIKELMPVTA